MDNRLKARAVLCNDYSIADIAARVPVQKGFGVAAEKIAGTKALAEDEEEKRNLLVKRQYKERPIALTKT